MTDPAPKLADRVAIVTGSTSGIGKGIARRFAAEGARVVVSGRDGAAGERVVSEILSAGGRADFRRADLTREEDCIGLIAFGVERFGGLDVLVNNAADTSRGFVEDTPTELLDRILAVNLRAPFILIREAVPHMRKRGRGSVINIGSVNAYIGEPKLCAYSASKGGLMTLTKNAASHLNRYRIRVNQINAGWTETEGEHAVKLKEGKGPEWLAEAIATRPFGRLLTPDDVAKMCVYFASDDAECVTGCAMDFEQYPVGAPPNW